MNKKDITARHWRVWEEQNKQLRRTVAASLVFAVIALFNIIIPYNHLFFEKAQIAKQIETAQTQLDDIKTAFADLQNLQKAMTDVEREIKRRAWDAKRFELIDKYSDLRRRRIGSPELYQSMADSTVRAIAQQVEKLVYAPLAAFQKPDSKAFEYAPKTMQQVQQLSKTLRDWQIENLNHAWYRTPEMKRETIDDLSTSLDNNLTALSQALLQERQKLGASQQELKKQIHDLQHIDVDAQEKELEALEERMTQILPSWLHGLISIEQLALYFPHVIAGLLLFVLWLGYSLSRHFSAAVSDISDKSISADPVLSSNWTLVNRTGRGTLQTLGSYLLYTALMFVFFEKSLVVLHESAIAENLRAATLLFSPYFFWLLRIVMAGSFLYIVTPILTKRAPSRSAR